MPVNLAVSYQVSRTGSGLVTPSLASTTRAMAQKACVGAYTLYKATYTIPGGQSYNSRNNNVSGTGSDAVSDAFKATGQLPETCETYSGRIACSNVTVSSISSTAQPTTSTSTSTSTSASATPTGPSQPATVGAWKWYGCQTEATNLRALSLATFVNDSMTLESCSTFCAGCNDFGVEYAHEW